MYILFFLIFQQIFIYFYLSKAVISSIPQNNFD